MSKPLQHAAAKAIAAAWLAGCAAAMAAPVSGQGTWESTLQARDVNGDGVTDAYFDTALNITWLANWNANGPMTWADANAWAAGLDVHGVTGWRLPSTAASGMGRFWCVSDASVHDVFSTRRTSPPPPAFIARNTSRARVTCPTPCTSKRK